MKGFLILLFCFTTVLTSSNAQTNITDPLTGKSFSRTQVLGYSIIAVGLACIAEGVISANNSKANASNNPQSLFITGGACIGGGVALVIIGGKKKKRKNKNSLNPNF